MGEQTVYCELSAASNVHFAVHHRWNCKFDGSSSLIAITRLIAVIKLTRYVVRVIGMQHSRPASMLINLQGPHDPIGTSIRRDGRRAPRIAEDRWRFRG